MQLTEVDQKPHLLQTNQRLSSLNGNTTPSMNRPLCIEATQSISGYKQNFDINFDKDFIMPSRDQINNRYNFDPKYWIDRGNYWLNSEPQGSDECNLNIKLRLTASNFGAALNKSNFFTPIDLALDITNIVRGRNSTHIDRNKFSTQHGVVTEPKARNWYCRTRNVVVVEVGLAVPKWEPRICALLDGDIKDTDGIIEIKSPLEMYEPLRNHMSKIKTGWKPPPFYHEHIWESHYAQMQGSMKIVGKHWCDYIVFATESNLSYVERVPFNQKYWDETLWPCIQNFLNNIMEPIIFKKNSNPN